MLPANTGSRPPRNVTTSPRAVRVLNRTRRPAIMPERMVQGTAVRLDRVAMEAMAVGDASGKLLEIVARAGEVAEAARVMKDMARIARMDLSF